MNIVFMGTPTFALPALDALAERFGVQAVFTRPDAPSHRGKTRLPSLVKARALELGIPVETPESFYTQLDDCAPLMDAEGGRVMDAEVLASIKKHNPDVIVVAAYGMLLTPEILTMPPAGCINIHASLLPRWRGAAPIQRGLLAGDEQVGVSLMRMTEGLDTGPYCAQAGIPTTDKNYQQLITLLGDLGAELLVQHLEAIVAGDATWTEQDESLVTYADKVNKGEVDLDAHLTVIENYNRVRASTHHARCRTTLFDKPVMVLEACPATEHNKKSVYFECSDGLLEILALKPDGRKEMTGAAFLAGLRS